MSCNFPIRRSAEGYYRFFYYHFSPNGDNQKRGRDYSRIVDKDVKEILKRDCLFLQKCLISRYFNIPIDQVTERLSSKEISDYATGAYWMIYNIDLAPFREKK